MKTSHKKVRIKKGRLLLFVGLIVLAIVAGYKSKTSYPAEPVSAWYTLALLAGFGLLCYLAEFVGKKRKPVCRRARG